MKMNSSCESCNSRFDSSTYNRQSLNARGSCEMYHRSGEQNDFVSTLSLVTMQTHRDLFKSTDWQIIIYSWSVSSVLYAHRRQPLKIFIIEIQYLSLHSADCFSTVFILLLIISHTLHFTNRVRKWFSGTGTYETQSSILLGKQTTALSPYLVYSECVHSLNCK